MSLEDQPRGGALRCRDALPHLTASAGGAYGSRSRRRRQPHQAQSAATRTTVLTHGALGQRGQADAAASAHGRTAPQRGAHEEKSGSTWTPWCRLTRGEARRKEKTEKEADDHYERERESRWCSWAADGDTAAACLFAVLLCSLALPALLARYAWSASAGTCSAQRSTWLSRGCVRRRRKGRRSWGDRKKKQVSVSCLGVRCWVSLGCPSPLPTALQGDRGWPATETLQGATEARGGKSKGEEEEQKEEESDRETVEERSERTRAQQRGAVVPTRESRSRGLWPRKTKKSTHTHTQARKIKKQDKTRMS